MFKRIGSFLAPILVAAAFLAVAGVQLTHANEPRALAASKTNDFASIADGDAGTTDVTVPGAALGDFCIASLGISSGGLGVTCAMKSTGVVSVILLNNTGGAVDLASTTVRVQVVKRALF